MGEGDPAKPELVTFATALRRTVAFAQLLGA
jgi:hypothetical protein